MALAAVLKNPLATTGGPRMNRDEAQRRANLITFLRTANVEMLATATLQEFADRLRDHGAFVVPPAPRPDRCAHGYLLEDLKTGASVCERCDEAVGNL